jgi:DNA-binding NtrC family response regulator
MKKILLIEDNKDHSELITRSLRQGLEDVQIQQTYRVKEAVELLKKKSFDLILTDFYLPDSRGEGHIRRLAQMVPETPIIIITGQGDEKTAARSIKAGADDYIIKTREALQALPRILNRAFAKHQSTLNKKRKEFRRQLGAQEKAMKKILGEVQVLEKEIGRLKQGKTPLRKTQKTTATSLESLIRQVGSLKDFIQKIFLSGD